MVEEGSRVRLQPDSAMARGHAGLVGAVGIVGAIVQGRRWQRLDASVRFKAPPVVLMSVPVSDLETVDQLDPALPADG